MVEVCGGDGDGGVGGGDNDGGFTGEEDRTTQYLFLKQISS